MVKQELVEAYESFDMRRKLYEKATRFGSAITGLGFLILLLDIFPLIPLFLEQFLGVEFIHPFLGCILLGFLLIAFGQRIYRKNLALAPSLSSNEEAFLNVFKALRNLDTYRKKKNGIGYLRVEAKKNLSKVVKALSEPTGSSRYLWRTLTKDLDEELRLLKRNIKEIILPVSIKGEREDVEKVYPVVEKLARYLLNPTMMSLRDLNESASKLPFRVEEEVPLIPFLERYPKLRYAGIEFIFGFVGFVAYYIGTTFLNISTEHAYYLAWIIWVTLTAGYMAIVKRKG